MAQVVCTSEYCPVENVAKLLSDRWTILIIRDILARPMRFNELMRSLKSISTRTLTLKLKRLLELGILQHDGGLYAVTRKGVKLDKVISAMAECDLDA